MSKREDCLDYLVKNYLQWPAMSALCPEPWKAHHGYEWHRIITCDGPWAMVSANAFSIREEDWLEHYANTVKMSDHFDTAAGDSTLAGLDPDDEITLSFSVTEARAMFTAIKRYDGLNLRLQHAKRVIRLLSDELGE